MKSRSPKPWAAGGAIALTATGARAVVTVVSVPLSIRLLGFQSFGIWNICQTLIQLTPVSFVGFNAAASYFTASSLAAEDGARLRLVIQRSFWFCAAGATLYAILLVTGAPIVEAAFLGSPDDGTDLLLATSAGAVTFGLRAWFTAIEVGFQRYGMAVGLETITNVIATLLGIAVAAAGGAVSSMVWAYGAVSSISVAVHYLAMRSEFTFAAGDSSSKEPGAEAPRMLRYGLAQFTSQVGGVLFGQVDRLLVSIFFGPAAVGIYAAVIALGGRINELSAAAAQVLMPRFAMTTASGMDDDSRRTFESSTAVINALVVVLAGSALAASGLILTVLDLRGIDDALVLLLIVVPAYALYSTNTVGFFATQGLGRPGINALYTGVAGLAFATCFWGALTLGASLPVASLANFCFSLTLLINLDVAQRIGYSRRRFLVHTGKSSASIAAIVGVVAVGHELNSGSWKMFFLVEPMVLLLAITVLGGHRHSLLRVARATLHVGATARSAPL